MTKASLLAEAFQVARDVEFLRQRCWLLDDVKEQSIRPAFRNLERCSSCSTF